MGTGRDESPTVWFGVAVGPSDGTALAALGTGLGGVAGAVVGDTPPQAATTRVKATKTRLILSSGQPEVAVGWMILSYPSCDGCRSEFCT